MKDKQKEWFTPESLVWWQLVIFPFAVIGLWMTLTFIGLVEVFQIGIRRLKGLQ